MLESIDTHVMMTQPMGKGQSMLAHDQKMLRDYDAGRISAELIGNISEMRARVERVTSFTPSRVLAIPYRVFHRIRPTKSEDYPINHSDIAAYCSVYKCTMANVFVDAVLAMDKTFYSSLSKHGSK